jgi:hypothetical protein
VKKIKKDIMKRLEYLKAFNSPFKRPKLKWYFGEVAIGTPYFFPRRWVKPTHEMAVEAAMKEIADVEKWNDKNPKYKRRVRPLDEVYKEKLRSQFAVPKRIGFDMVDLGWKTKWGNTDYRFEWAPLISFVFFKWQIAVVVIAPEQSQYWEAWLYYHCDTNGTPKERIEQCKKGFPLNYTVHRTGQEPEKINYYNLILKDKYK